MLARKLFGKKATVEEPRRPAVPPQAQIFDESLFEGEIGDFRRQNGYAPDDPRNQAVNVQPVSVLLAEDQWAMRKATEASQIYPVFRDLFKKEGATAAAA